MSIWSALHIDRERFFYLKITGGYFLFLYEENGNFQFDAAEMSTAAICLVLQVTLLRTHFYRER